MPQDFTDSVLSILRFSTAYLGSGHRDMQSKEKSSDSPHHSHQDNLSSQMPEPPHLPPFLFLQESKCI